ncbi:MAG: hypothetical protein WCO52_06625 [bacterium]
MKIKAFFNKLTNNELPAGVWGDNFDNHCKQHPEEFDVIYSDEPEEATEAVTHYEKGSLNSLSMKALREVYDSLAEGKEDAPPPTTSKDGIIKSILELQGA